MHLDFRSTKSLNPRALRKPGSPGELTSHRVRELTVLYSRNLGAEIPAAEGREATV